MIGQTLLRRSLAQSRYGAQVVSASNRSFAGGGNKPKPIDPKTTDYDILFVGKHSSFAHLPSSKSFCGTDCYLLFYRKSSLAWRLLTQLTSALAIVLTWLYRWYQRCCSPQAHPATRWCASLAPQDGHNLRAHWLYPPLSLFLSLPLSCSRA